MGNQGVDKNISKNYHQMAQRIINRVSGKEGQNVVPLDTSPELLGVLGDDFEGKKYEDLKPADKYFIDNALNTDGNKKDISKEELASLLYRADGSRTGTTPLDQMSKMNGIPSMPDMTALSDKYNQEYLIQELNNTKLDENTKEQAEKRINDHSYRVYDMDFDRPLEENVVNIYNISKEPNTGEDSYSAGTMSELATDILDQNTDELGNKGKKLFFRTLAQKGEIGKVKTNDSGKYQHITAKAGEKTERNNPWYNRKDEDKVVEIPIKIKSQTYSESDQARENFETGLNTPVAYSKVNRYEPLPASPVIKKYLADVKENIVTKERAQEFKNNLDLDSPESMKPQYTSMVADISKAAGLDETLPVEFINNEIPFLAEVNFSENGNEMVVNKTEIKNVINEYRELGLSDDEIKNKITARLIEVAAHETGHLLQDKMLKNSDAYEGDDAKVAQRLRKERRFILDSLESRVLSGKYNSYTNTTHESQMYKVTEEMIEHVENLLK